MKALPIVLALLVVPLAASAELFVMGNNETGAVLIRGNFPNGTEVRSGRLARLAARW